MTDTPTLIQELREAVADGPEAVTPDLLERAIAQVQALQQANEQLRGPLNPSERVVFESMGRAINDAEAAAEAAGFTEGTYLAEVIQTLAAERDALKQEIAGVRHYLDEVLAHQKHAVARGDELVAERDALKGENERLKIHADKCGSCFALAEESRKREAAESQLRELREALKERSVAFHNAERSRTATFMTTHGERFGRIYESWEECPDFRCAKDRALAHSSPPEPSEVQKT